MLWAAVLQAQTSVPTLSWALCQVLRQGERIGRHVPVWRTHTQKPVILTLGINVTMERKELPTPPGRRSRSEKLHPGGRLVCLKGEQDQLIRHIGTIPLPTPFSEADFINLENEGRPLIGGQT